MNGFIVIMLIVAAGVGIMAGPYMKTKSRLERRVLGMILIVVVFFITVVIAGVLGM